MSLAKQQGLALKPTILRAEVHRRLAAEAVREEMAGIAPFGIMVEEVEQSAVTSNGSLK